MNVHLKSVVAQNFTMLRRLTISSNLCCMLVGSEQICSKSNDFIPNIQMFSKENVKYWVKIKIFRTKVLHF